MSKSAVMTDGKATSSKIGLVRFVTMGISKVSESEACVGAIAEDGTWVRPETPTLAEAKAGDSPFVYFQWANAELEESLAGDARPEDHHMVRRARAEWQLPNSSQLDFLRSHLDESAEDAFAGLRSLGLIRVSVNRIYMKQSTGGRVFTRVEFTDGRGDTYDWIISEVRFPELLASHLVNGEIPAALGEKLNAFFRSAEVYFTLALTKPNNRFPGKFRGCHPVVIGIHTSPDYADQLRDDAGGGNLT